MAVELRPLTALIVLAAVLAFASVGSLAVTETVDEPSEQPSHTIEVGGEDDRSLWLYTSRSRSFDQWTLAINVIVYGPPEATERRLTAGTWEETPDNEEDIDVDESGAAVDEGSVQWERATGANRYAHRFDGETGRWLSEAYQLHDGDYLGRRHHVRAYTPPGDASWTAIQAHDEHWDWFSGRHVVTSVESSQAHVETEFVDERSYDVVKLHVDGEDRSDFDGWVTIVNPRDGTPSPEIAVLAAFGLLGAVTTGTGSIQKRVQPLVRHQGLRALVLATAIAALYVGVRLLGVGLERSLDVPPKPIAVLLYPLLFVGLPVTTYLLGRQLERPWAFSGAAMGLLLGVLIDFTYLGVTAIPLDVLVHRGALAVTLGFLAAGASRTERADPNQVSHVRLAVLMWAVAMLQPLLRHTPIPV